VKINFILPFYSARPIGGLKVAYEYANELIRRGHEVSVVHPRRMKNVEIAAGPLRVLHNAALDTRNLFAPRAGLKWQPLHEQLRILIVPDPTARNIPDADAVFATAWQTAEYVRDYPPRKGKQFYLVMDFDPWIASKEVLAETWRRPLAKVTISNWLYHKVISAGCIRSEVTNIPIGINFEQFNLRADIGKRARRILMLFSHSPSKGSEIGLSALERVRRTHQDTEVCLFGPTTRRRPPNLPAWARFLGNVSNEQLGWLYNESRIYVCSSWAEGFALPPAEAMACGCVVAATDCGGITEFATDGVNALLSPPGDAEALARNIARLLDDDQLRTSLAKTGHDSIQSFTWQAATVKLEEFIKQQIDRSGALPGARAAHA
jgi:glycosyltransferase involved in cell wall biosynthesis